MEKQDTYPNTKGDPIVTEGLGIDTKLITMEELKNTTKRMKTRKAPGPDESITELFKWLNGDNIDILTDLFNFILTN